MNRKQTNWNYLTFVDVLNELEKMLHIYSSIPVYLISRCYQFFPVEIDATYCLPSDIDYSDIEFREFK